MVYAIHLLDYLKLYDGRPCYSAGTKAMHGIMELHRRLNLIVNDGLNNLPHYEIQDFGYICRTFYF